MSEEMTAGAPMIELIIDTMYQRAVGVCIGSKCDREFISKERYDDVIAPEFRSIQSKLTTLEAENERLKNTNAEWWELANVTQDKAEGAIKRNIELKQAEDRLQRKIKEQDNLLDECVSECEWLDENWDTLPIEAKYGFVLKILTKLRDRKK